MEHAFNTEESCLINSFNKYLAIQQIFIDVCSVPGSVITPGDESFPLGMLCSNLTRAL